MEAHKVNANVCEKSGRLYVVLSWKDISGKRRQKWVATGMDVKGNKRKAIALIPDLVEKKEKELIAACSSEPCEITGDTLFTDYLNDWIKLVKHSLAISTYHEYERLIRKNINPYFLKKKISLSKLEGVHIQRFYNYLIEEKNLSAASVKRHHAIIHRALNAAISRRLIPFNPSDHIDLPKGKKFIGSYYTAEELRRLLEITKDTKLEIPVRLAIWLGLRRGEICGLQWKYVDFKGKTISIRGVITDRHDGTCDERIVYVPDTKTRSSNRVLPLSDDVVAYLKAVKAQQDKQRLICGMSYNSKWEGFVCVDNMGSIISTEYISYTFPKLLERNGMRVIRFHDLRHTNATLLIGSGANIKDVQAWLGHSNYSTTADIYAHVIEANKKTLASTISSLIG